MKSDSDATSQPIDPAADAPSMAGWKRWVETPTRKAIAIATGLGVLIGLATASIELYGQLFPPDPPVAVTIKPATAVEPDVTWGNAVAAIPELGDGSYGPEQLAEIGAVFTLDLEIKGQAGRSGELRWQTLDKDGVELSVPAWAPTSVSLRPATDDEPLTQKVWTPLPRGVEAFQLEFAYEDDDGVTRDTERGPLVRLGIG